MFDINWLDDPVIRTRLLPWLGTYAVHSTLLLAAAWTFSRPIGRRWPALEEMLWKGALLGGVVTASLSFAGWKPVLPWTVSGTVAAAGHPMTAIAMTAAPQTATTSPWLGLAVVAWAAVVLAFLVSLGFSWWRLRRRLARREAIVVGPLPAVLDELCREAGYRRRVRLTSSEEIDVPVAFGLLRPEICLPARATAELSRAQLTAAIGHELAHLTRRDPGWRLAARLFEGVFFFQPLHRLAARRLEQLSEYLCDDWAAHRAGGVNLARCLAEVADWSISRPRLFPVPGMAVRRSELERRVRRLLDRAGDHTPAPRRRFALLAVAALLATTWMAPSWSAAPGVGGPEEDQAEESAEARDEEPGEEKALEAERREHYERRLRQLEAALHEREGAYRMREDALREHEAALRRQVEKLRLQEAEIREQAELLEGQLRQRAEELQQQEELMRDMLHRQEGELRRQHELLETRARQQEEKVLDEARRMEEKARQMSEYGRQQEAASREHARMMVEKAQELAERGQQREQQVLEEARRLEERARELAEEERQREKDEEEDSDG